MSIPCVKSNNMQFIFYTAVMKFRTELSLCCWPLELHDRKLTSYDFPLHLVSAQRSMFTVQMTDEHTALFVGKALCVTFCHVYATFTWQRTACHTLSAEFRKACPRLESTTLSLMCGQPTPVLPCKSISFLATFANIHSLKNLIDNQC